MSREDALHQIAVLCDQIRVAHPDDLARLHDQRARIKRAISPLEEHDCRRIDYYRHALRTHQETTT